MRDFDQQYPNARAVSDKASWPRGVHKLSQIGLEAKWSRSPVRPNFALADQVTPTLDDMAKFRALLVTKDGDRQSIAATELSGC
jgi:hypothetical protein